MYNIDFGGKGYNGAHKGRVLRDVHYAKRGHLWEVFEHFCSSL